MRLCPNDKEEALRYRGYCQKKEEVMIKINRLNNLFTVQNLNQDVSILKYPSYIVDDFI